MTKREPGGVLVVTNAAVARFGEAVWYFPPPYHVALYLNDAVHSFGLIKNSTQHAPLRFSFSDLELLVLRTLNTLPTPQQYRQLLRSQEDRASGGAV